jgi:hypothetical protein
LRSDDAALATSFGLAVASAWQVFAEIRERKNKS